MGNNVATNGLLCVSCEHGATIDLGDDLVGDHNGHPELISDPLERS